MCYAKPSRFLKPGRFLSRLKRIAANIFNNYLQPKRIFMTTHTPLLRAGHNCWRLERADRVALLVDTAAYFKTAREAMKQAQHSIFIMGWEMDSRTRLIRGDDSDDGLPEELGPFLSQLVTRKRDLYAYLMMWDFAMIYLIEREFPPLYQVEWSNHGRLKFRMDDQHPLGASRHQKLLVIDDRLAFIGGIDLSKWRWDTPAHAAHEPRRIDPDGKPYPPFHDVQAMVDGPAAAALGELVRERWHLLGGKKIKPSQQDLPVPWPDGVAVWLRNVKLGLARTEPQYKQQAEVCEIERLYLDVIRYAQRWIYIENQYLTSSVVGNALSERLASEDGVEIIIVLPLQTGGWLEQNTMDVLRARLLRRLRAADKHQRLRVYYPHIPELADNTCLSVHSKLLIADERYFLLGSANLSNRSMGLDSEANIALEAKTDEESRAIAEFRDALLAEHLDVSPETVAQTLQQRQSLLATVENLRTEARSLRPLSAEVSEDVDQMVPEAAVIDPERPITAEKLSEEFLPKEDKRSAIRRLLMIGALLTGLLALTAAWQWTPLGDHLNIDAIALWLDKQAAASFGPAWIIGIFLLGGLVMMPLTLMVVAAALVFGPFIGFVYALTGALSSAALSYFIGAWLGRSAVRNLAGSSLNRLSKQLGRQGFLTVAVLRMFPIAPFTVVNLVAGASHIHFKAFFFGSLLGMMPGMLMITVFADGLRMAVTQPNSATILLSAALLALLAVGMWAFRRWLLRQNDNAQKP
jgi:phosphatidylserine/phosphatidylglycerophosphate/cardiolipin synthase-like enzyme/membrane protein DedA with SNARE-associated domain